MHQVGEFLGYSNKDNYKTLRKCLNELQFEENVDWKIQKPAGIHTYRLPSTENPEINLGGSGLM